MPSDRCRSAAMSATVPPSRAARSTSVSRAVSGLAPGDQRLGGQRGVDHPQPGVHPAHRVGELAGRGVLDDEPAGPGLHRAAQVAGPAERRHDQHPARRAARPAARRWRRCRPARASRRRAGRRRPVRRGRGDHLVAAAHLGHHLEVGLEVEQRGQRAAHERLVVGEQQPDRCVVTRRPAARKPPSAAPAGHRAGRADGRSARSRSPRQPVPPPTGVRPRARGRRRVTSTRVRVERDAAAARAAVPHHVGDALAERPGEQLAAARPARRRRRSAGRRRSRRRPAPCRARGQLAGQRQLAACPPTVARTSASASRASRSTSAISARTRPRPASGTARAAGRRARPSP